MVRKKRVSHQYQIEADRPDLTPEASILYSSDSVTGVLGYTPGEIVNCSAWDFFSEKELAFAKPFHQRCIVEDEPAVLAYCRIQNKVGKWIGCECCLTIAYDIMVVCTSVYHRDGNSSGKFSFEAWRPKSSSHNS
jgi:hypothetical protein